MFLDFAETWQALLLYRTNLDKNYSKQAARLYARWLYVVDSYVVVYCGDTLKKKSLDSNL